MTGHKKQKGKGRSDLEEYGEIERVSPQHLPRVTTSLQEVLTTAVLAVCCSACMTEQDPDTQKLKIHQNVKKRKHEKAVCEVSKLLFISCSFFVAFYKSYLQCVSCQIVVQN